MIAQENMVINDNGVDGSLLNIGNERNFLDEIFLIG